MSAGAGHRLARWPSCWIAVRYLGAVRQSRTISAISTISIVGLVLGVAALVTVLSVMNGFDRELRTRMLGIVPHITLQPDERSQVPSLLRSVRQQPGVTGAARFAETGAMIGDGSRVLPVAVFGIDPAIEPRLSPLADHLLDGRLAALEPDRGMILGSSLAARLGVMPGDRVTLTLPRAAGRSVQPVIATTEVTGIFQLNAEPDQGLVYVHVDYLTERHRVAPANVRVAVDNIYQAPRQGRRLGQALQLPPSSVSDWTARHGELFQAVGLEKTMMGLLLLLVVAVAVFNITASLAMLVDEKRAAIAILRTLGMSRGAVVRIFLLQGMLIGTLGIAGGLLLGTLLASQIGNLVATLEQLLNFRMLAGTYFERLPSELRMGDLLTVGVVAWLLTVAGALYPAWRAGAIPPAQALHR